MADLRGKIGALYSLEQLAGGQTALHRLHPLAKITVTAVYLVCVMSFGNATVGRLAPYFFYPVLMISLADIPFGMIARRTAIALPFCLLAGLSNLLLDHRTAFVLGGLTVTVGAVSLLSILLRTVLCVAAVLVLVAVTPFQSMTAALRRLGVPRLAVMLLEMTYRYIGVLAEEALSMLTAYRLRANGKRWPELKDFGAFLGQLLLRSADRAERVYHAMQCRLYGAAQNPQNRRGTAQKFTMGDGLFLLVGAGSAVLFRLFDLPAWLGGLLL